MTIILWEGQTSDRLYDKKHNNYEEEKNRTEGKSEGRA